MKMQFFLVMSVVTFSVCPSFAFVYESTLPAALKSQIQSDFEVVNTIEGSGQSPLHAKVFGKVLGAKYMHWFQSRIDTIGYVTTNGQEGSSAYVDVGDPHRMVIEQMYMTGNNPQAMRISIIFHEARHSEVENGNWLHADCPTPFPDEEGHSRISVISGLPLAGKAACDTTPIGSYGIETILLDNLSRFCKNCTEKFKMDAALFSHDIIHRIVDKTAYQSLMKDAARASEH